MANRLTWSRRAVQDLEAIAEYIDTDSPVYARIVAKKIANQTKALVKFPKLGQKVPEFNDENVRELLVYSYRIIYHIQEEGVLVSAVIHGRRNLR